MTLLNGPAIMALVLHSSELQLDGFVFPTSWRDAVHLKVLCYV